MIYINTSHLMARLPPRPSHASGPRKQFQKLHLGMARFSHMGLVGVYSQSVKDEPAAQLEELAVGAGIAEPASADVGECLLNDEITLEGFVGALLSDEGDNGPDEFYVALKSMNFQCAALAEMTNIIASPQIIDEHVYDKIEALETAIQQRVGDLCPTSPGQTLSVDPPVCDPPVCGTETHNPQRQANQNVANVANAILSRKLRHFNHFQNVAPKCSTTFSIFCRVYAYFWSSENVASYSLYFIVYIGLDILLHSWYCKNM